MSEWRGRQGPGHLGPVCGPGLDIGLDSRCYVVSSEALNRMLWSDVGREVQSSLGDSRGELALALCWPQ